MTKKSSHLGFLLLAIALIAGLAGCLPAVAPAQPAPAATQAPAAEQPAPAATQAPAATEPPAAAPTAAATQASAPAPAAVSFTGDVAPILEQRCLKCHGGSDGTKGGFSVKSYDDLMAGSKDGPAVVPGDAANSQMVQLIVSGEMPKRATKLPQTEIDAISAWIAAGAKND